MGGTRRRRGASRLALAMVPAMVSACLCAACGDGERTSGSGGGTAGAGGDGGAIDCGALAVRTADGACVEVGVDTCPEGFEPAGAGCAPVLVELACEPGMMALAGETTCREILDCGQGPWGDVPLEPGALFVDASYAGPEPSDGSEQRPFTTIGAAMGAVPVDGQVVVAEGQYDEQLIFQGARVRLWGRCPRLVRITSSVAEQGALQLTGFPDGHEIHGVRVDGAGFGITMSDVSDVLIDRVWVTETANPGISAEDVLGPVTFHLVDSLIENVGEVGVNVGGVEAFVERTEIRDVASGPGGSGVGLGILSRTGPAAVVADRLHLHRLVGAAVGGIASSLAMSDSAVHDVAPVADVLVDGVGLALFGGPLGPFDVALDGTSVERVHEAGIILDGATGTVERSSFRDVFPQAADQLGGIGISIQSGAQTGTPDVIVRRSSTSRTPLFGIIVADASAVVEESAMVRGDPSVGADVLGDGLVVVSFDQEAQLRMSRSWVEGHNRAGVSNFAATASVGESVLECNEVDLDGEVTSSGDFTFTDEGDNRCGCGGEVVACKVQSTNLSPPTPP